MKVRRILASLAVVGLALTGAAATPGYAQEQPADDVGLWLLGGFVVAEVILVTVLASDDDLDHENPISP